LLDDIPSSSHKSILYLELSVQNIFPEMPLTGDLTTGVYWRPEGKEYLAGSPPFCI